jgi:hypothetical protein
MWIFCIFLCKIFSKIIQPAQFDYVILHISVQVVHHTNNEDKQNDKHNTENQKDEQHGPLQKREGDLGAREG